MTKQTKIIIGIVAGILVLCLITCVAAFLFLRIAGSRVSESVAQDPVAVETTVNEIVDFDLPAGFQPQSSLDLLGMKMAMYQNDANNNFMVVMQLPIAAGQDTIEQMQQAFERNTGRNFSNMKVIEQRDLTVRGQPAKMIISEGLEGESNTPIRQMLVAFEGSGGTAMITVFGPSDSWDQDTYDRMVESIR